MSAVSGVVLNSDAEKKAACGEFNSISTFSRVKTWSCPIVLLSIRYVLPSVICRLCLGSF